jgi:hypothetical protein
MNARGAYLTWPLPDGRVADVIPLTFGRARIVVSATLTSVVYDDGW